MTDKATLAERFVEARRSGAALADFPGELPETLEASYVIQDEAIARWGRPVIGWKVGRIAPPLAERLGAERLAGPVFHSAAAGSGAAPNMPVFADGYAAVEAEFMLLIGTAPAPGKRSFTPAEAAALIERVHIGIEIASSPLRSINALGPLAVVSDFGNNNGIIVGGEVKPWRGRGFEAWSVSTSIDGLEVGTGRAAAFPDGVMGAAQFLFELLALRGIAVRPGQWISSGAVTGVHEAQPGQKIEALFGEAGSVTCTLVAVRRE